MSYNKITTHTRITIYFHILLLRLLIHNCLVSFKALLRTSICPFFMLIIKQIPYNNKIFKYCAKLFFLAAPRFGEVDGCL